MLSRREFLAVLSCLAAARVMAREARRPKLGAIRWDAWHGAAGGPGIAVEKSLGPEKYHWRLPFFAKVLAPDKVEIRSDNQAVMDQEIAYAQAGGIDYWAFVTYDPNSSMSLGLKHYLSSEHRTDVNFCLLTEQGKWGAPGSYQQSVDRFVSLMAEPGYQTVLGNRPLFYLGFIKEEWTNRWWGSFAAFRKPLDAAKEAAVKAGLGEPYYVLCDFSPERAARHAKILGCDAISSYALWGGNSEGEPFAVLAARVRTFWSQCRETGLDVVPLVSAGWDNRPRVDNPVPWTKGGNNHYVTPTPEELAALVKDAFDWVATHPVAAKSEAVLTYAWNENDEGGWLVPTLNPDGSANTGRLDALGELTKAWQPPE